MLCGSVAGRAVIDLGGMLLGIGNEGGNGLRWERLANRHNVWESNNATYRRYIFDKIETELFEQRRIDRVHSPAQQEGVTVRRCANRRLSSEVASRAGPVLDDELLP